MRNPPAAKNGRNAKPRLVRPAGEAIGQEIIFYVSVMIVRALPRTLVVIFPIIALIHRYLFLDPHRHAHVQVEVAAFSEFDFTKAILLADFRILDLNPVDIVRCRELWVDTSCDRIDVLYMPLQTIRVTQSY